MQTLLTAWLVILALCILPGCDPLSGPKMEDYAKEATSIGWHYVNVGDLDTAERRFRIAIRHNRKYPAAHFGLGYVLSTKGEIQDAVASYERAVKLDQYNESAWANLGQAYGILNKTYLAHRAFSRALRINPKSQNANFGMAKLTSDAGDWKSARDYMRLAVEAGYNPTPTVIQEFLESGFPLETPQGCEHPKGSCEGGQ